MTGNRPARRFFRRPLDLPKRAPRRRFPRQGSAAVAGGDIRGELSHDSGPVPCQAGADFGIDGRALLCPPFPYPGRRFIRPGSEKVLQTEACSPVFFCDALRTGQSGPFSRALSCLLHSLCGSCAGLAAGLSFGLSGQRVCSHWVGWTRGHLVSVAWSELPGGARDPRLRRGEGRDFQPLPRLTDPA